MINNEESIIEPANPDQHLTNFLNSLISIKYTKFIKSRI